MNGKALLGVVLLGALTVVYGGVLKVEAQAQPVDVTLSLSVPFSLGGVALEEAALSAVVSTAVGEIALKATADLTLEGLSQASLSAKTTVAEISVSGKASFSMEGFRSAKLSLSRTLDPFGLSLSLAVSPQGWESATFSAQTQTEQGVSLSGSTTLTPAGFSQKVLSLGLAVQDLQLQRTTVLTPQGLAQETWSLIAQVGDYTLSRTTVYTAEGFSSETISLSTTVREIAVSAVTTFDATGFAGASLDLSGALTEEVRFRSSTSLGPEGFQQEKLTLSGSLERFDWAGTFWLSPQGFERGRLDLTTSFQMGGEAPPASPPEG